LIGVRGHSLLVVPLPGLVSVVPPLSRGAVVPHIPLVDPFADPPRIDEGVLAELRDYFADVVPFAVRLTELSQYPGGSAYLAPDPTAPFRHLTQGLLRLFPELPRRRPSFELVPHLAVELPPGEDLELLREQLDPWLPVATLARQAALWLQDDGVRTLATFPFGTSAA
jgi:hypothetical protein